MEAIDCVLRTFLNPYEIHFHTDSTFVLHSITDLAIPTTECQLGHWCSPTTVTFAPACSASFRATECDASAAQEDQDHWGSRWKRSALFQSSVRIKSKIASSTLANTQHTTHNTQHTTHNTQHATHNTQHTTRNTQHTTHNTQHATGNTQHATRNTQHATRNTQYAIRNTQHATRNTQHNTQHTTHNTQHTSRNT